jgi:NAD+ synthase (glutamine-hydrolysing)
VSKALNVAVCQINPTLGNFQKNIDIISKNYKSAVEKGADLVVFPEMSITGYPPQDLLNNKEFISQNISCLNELTKSITIPCILGYVDFINITKFIYQIMMYLMKEDIFIAVIQLEYLI